MAAIINPKLMSTMKYLLILCFSLAASLTAFAGAATNDTATVQGSWKPAVAELGGHPMSEALLKTISLKLDDGKYEVFVGTEPDRGTYTIDPTTTPKQMTIKGTEDPNHGRTFPAIYEISGDTLRICYDLSGANTPATFKTMAGTKLYLVTYQRVKP